MREVIASVYGWLQAKIDRPLCYHGHTYNCEYPVYMMTLGDLKLLPPYGTPVANLCLPIKLSALSAEDDLATVRQMINLLIEKLTTEQDERKIQLYQWDMKNYPPDDNCRAGFASYSWPIYHEEVIGDEMKLAVAEISFDVQFVWNHH